MAQKRTINPVTSGSFLVALLLLIAGVNPVYAQDSVTTTPPELRDFRLDPPPRAAEPSPDAAPPVTSPVLPPVEPPDTAPVQSAPTDPAPRRETPSRTPPTRAQQSDPAPLETPAPDASPLPPAQVDGSVLPAPQDDTEEAIASTSASDGDKTIFIIGGLVALLLVGGGLFLWRRRKAQEQHPILEPHAPTLPFGRTGDDHVRQIDPTPTEHLTARPKPAPVTAPPLPVAMTFLPDTAVISFTSLVVRGQLQIANSGGQPVPDLTLRAVLISASAEQQRAIDSFFANPRQVPPNIVGPLKSHERIGLSLELSVALNEMQTFAVGDKTLLVPILVAHLSRDGDPLDAGARLICMIGREANPPAAKMGPLRTDLGPRSFSGLGQRPLLT